MDDLSRISPQAVITLSVLLLLFIGLIPLIQADLLTETADAGSAVEIVATFESGGSYAATQSNDNSYFYGGSDNNNNNFRGYLELYYDLSSLGISPGDINSLNFNVTYCHSGDTAPLSGWCLRSSELETIRDGMLLAFKDDNEKQNIGLKAVM